MLIDDDILPDGLILPPALLRDAGFFCFGAIRENPNAEGYFSTKFRQIARVYLGRLIGGHGALRGRRVTRLMARSGLFEHRNPACARL